MRFQHTPEIWAQFPQLVPVAAVATGITAAANADAVVEEFSRRAEQRLAGRTESELPEIRSWRQAFSQLGLKPTQYRCASEALLRRFRKDGVLPRVHPLVDVCNALSIAYATPIAAFDLDQVRGDLQVRHTDGDESYLTFGDDVEHPQPGEVIFADAGGQAHARRWTNRQSGLSAVQPATTTVLIVSEALHPDRPEGPNPTPGRTHYRNRHDLALRRQRSHPDRHHTTARAIELRLPPDRGGIGYKSSI